MSSSSKRLVSEPVHPASGSFLNTAMAEGEPGIPLQFAWRGTQYRVVRILGSKKTLRNCHSGSDEKYVDKHYHRVETDSGEIMTLYRTRGGSRTVKWILYTIEPGESRMRIAVLVSGGGTNLQALIDDHAQEYSIVLVAADRDCKALERAEKANIPTTLCPPPSGLSRKDARSVVSANILEKCRDVKADAIVLAGFLTILSGEIIDAYSNRILNLHPALLPKFGGPGMWGHHVHEAVLAAGESESGCTIHLVDSGCDTGPILLQKKVPVLAGDTAETLAARISGVEHEAIVEGTRLLSVRLAENCKK